MQMCFIFVFTTLDDCTSQSSTPATTPTPNASLPPRIPQTNTSGSSQNSRSNFIPGTQRQKQTATFASSPKPFVLTARANTQSVSSHKVTFTIQHLSYALIECKV